MLKGGLVFGSIAGSALVCLAQITKPAASDNEHRWSQDTFRIIHRVSDLPPAVKKQFPAPDMQRDFRMADPGKPYQATCIVTKPRLPSRRLIFAGLSKDHCFVHYERGGRGYSRSLVVFRLSNNEARFIGGSNVRRPSPDLQALLASVQATDLENKQTYSW